MAYFPNIENTCAGVEDILKTFYPNSVESHRVKNAID